MSAVDFTYRAVITVTDYGDENPLLMDYYGFDPAFYKLRFKSRGDSALSQRVVQLYKNVRFYSGSALSDF